MRRSDWKLVKTGTSRAGRGWRERFQGALLTSIESVRATAMEYLPWMVVSPLLSVWSFAFDGIFVGATRAREMRNTMLLSLALFAFFSQQQSSRNLPPVR